MTDSALAAVLWDMDGTLIDSEPYWMRAEEDLVAEHGGTWTHEDALLLVGSGLESSAYILQSRGVQLSAEEIVQVLAGRVLEQLYDEVPWRSGALELLRGLRDAGTPTALVTMSTGPLARHVAAATGFDAFDAIVPGDEVSASKPHPQPYLEAVARLGVAAQACVAIEDSEPGVASAVAAGICTIAVPMHVPLPPSPAYTLWVDGFVTRSIEDLRAVLAEKVAP